MFRHRQLLQVTCLFTCLITLPWTNALAEGRIHDAIGRVSSETRLQSRDQGPRQSVATTTEPKLLLGIVSGALIVGGLAMTSYGSTATCKGKEAQRTGACDKLAMTGAIGFSAGAATLVLWALSRP